MIFLKFFTSFQRHFYNKIIGVLNGDLRLNLTWRGDKLREETRFIPLHQILRQFSFQNAQELSSTPSELLAIVLYFCCHIWRQTGVLSVTFSGRLRVKVQHGFYFAFAIHLSQQRQQCWSVFDILIIPQQSVDSDR